MEIRYNEMILFAIFGVIVNLIAGYIFGLIYRYTDKELAELSSSQLGNSDERFVSQCYFS